MGPPRNFDALFNDDGITQLIEGLRPGWKSELRTMSRRHQCHEYLIKNVAMTKG
jgi:hypothetical protein